MVVINERLKHVLNDMIYDLDRHFDNEVLTDEFYEDFLQRYIKPILDEILG